MEFPLFPRAPGLNRPLPPHPVSYQACVPRPLAHLVLIFSAPSSARPAAYSPSHAHSPEHPSFPRRPEGRASRAPPCDARIAPPCHSHPRAGRAVALSPSGRRHPYLVPDFLYGAALAGRLPTVLAAHTVAQADAAAADRRKTRSGRRAAEYEPPPASHVDEQQQRLVCVPVCQPLRR